MNRMLRTNQAYKSAAGRVLINTQYSPDANGYSFIGSVPDGSSVLYRADGYCEAAQYRITGPWLDDSAIYQPILPDAPTILGERYADILDLKKKHPGKYAARIQIVNGVPVLGLEAP